MPPARSPNANNTRIERSVTDRLDHVGSGQDTTIYRSHAGWYVFAVFFGFIVLICIGTAVNPFAPVPVATRIVCGLIAIAIVAMLVRGFRAGIEVGPDGITVRRYLGPNVQVAWSEIDHVQLVPDSRHLTYYIALVLRDGRQLKTRGLTAGGMNTRLYDRFIERIDAGRLARP